MSVLKVKLSAPQEIVVSASVASLLMNSGSGDATLLYIYILSNGGELDINAAAKRLSMSPDSVLSALDVLKGIGICEDSETRKIPERSDEVPEYSPVDVAEHLGGDLDFKSLVSFCEERLGKLLSTVDLQVLLGIYSWLGLPVDVICLLVTSCIEDTRKKFGEGRIPTMRTIEKRAKAWARDGVMTIGRAEEYLKELERENSDKFRVASLCGIAKRALAPTEDKYISEWVRLGISDELIELAYDKTVTNTGSLKWRYMDKILKTWFEKGIKRASEVESRDSVSASEDAQGADVGAAARLRELNRKKRLNKE